MIEEMVDHVPRTRTYMEGFDIISMGGLPKGRVTLVSGTTGSGKTIFATQFIVEGLKRDENAVFVTFEEPADDLYQNMAAFGWDLRRWETEKRLAFVDGSYDPSADSGTVVGSYDLGGLVARIEHAIKSVKASRVVLDSFSAVLGQFPDPGTLRAELFRISHDLKKLGVTTIITAERPTDYGDLSRSGVEEFVADNVVLLRNVISDEKRRRTVEVLKLRGARHQRGEFPATILSETGYIVVPLSGAQLKQRSSDIRITSGVPRLDEMCGGGYFRDSVILVSGATGTGKTLLVSEFLKGAMQTDERVLFFAFEESRDQLIRNATGWGIDLIEMEEAGKLKLFCQYPEITGPEEHLVDIKAAIEAFRPARVAIDSLSAIERVSAGKSFREFVLGLTSYIKDHDICGIFTASSERLLGGTSITDSHISTITDTIILLRYVERRGEIHRGVTVLKMRGSAHDKSIREFTIDQHGMHIGEPLRQVSGILSGIPVEEIFEPKS
jgi:circadian clock protein KaiC